MEFLYGYFVFKCQYDECASNCNIRGRVATKRGPLRLGSQVTSCPIGLPDTFSSHFRCIGVRELSRWWKVSVNKDAQPRHTLEDTNKRLLFALILDASFETFLLAIVRGYSIPRYKAGQASSAEDFLRLDTVLSLTVTLDM